MTHATAIIVTHATCGMCHAECKKIQTVNKSLQISSAQTNDGWKDAH